MKRIARIPRSAVILALLLLPAFAHGRSGGRITGKVLSPEGRALFGAVVTIFKDDRDGGTILYTRTNRQGEYNFPEVVPGSYSLHVNHEGFKPLVKPSLAIGKGRITTLNVILLDLLDLISADDPRNWGITTVMRSTSDRRMIFRVLDDPASNAAETDPRFERSAAVNLTSSTGLDSSDYSVYPSRGFTGVVSNFAYSEPVSRNTRMLFAGQLSAGADSLWRVRNTYQFQPHDGRDMRLSLGYGRQSPSGTGLGTIAGPAQFFALDPSFRDSGVETISLGFEASDRILDAYLIEYGVDLTRIRHGGARSVLSPHFRLTATPLPGWSFRAAMASRRFSEANSVTLPDGEVINLLEPVYITKIDGILSVTQLKHSELGIERGLGKKTSLGVALYLDRTVGPGIPLTMTVMTPGAQQSSLAQLKEDQARQGGLRVGINRRFMDSIDGSVSYVYARTSNLVAPALPVQSSMLADELSSYVQRAYVHSLTGSLGTRLDRTKTDIAAVVRWDGGNPLVPIDLFSDRMDNQAKGITFCIRQLIPMPDFLYGAGQWIALVDVRNMFNQGRYVIPATDGIIILTTSPRYLRFGLNLSFN
jgi:hypothetical protein